MRKSLGELINTALSDADSALKLASASDAEIRSSGDFLDAELMTHKLAAEDTFSEKEREGTKKLVEKHERKMHGEEKGEKEEASEKKSSRSSVLSAASYAMKLAEALEVGAHVVAKVAADTDPNTHEQRVTVSTGGAGASPLKAPGPQVMASGFIGAQTVQPKAQSAGAERITGPTTAAGNVPTNIADHTGNLDGEQPPNNTGKTAGFTRSKEASARLLRAKQAQAETLMRMGQIKEAERLLAEVEKAAQDPSSPGPELPAHSNSYMLSTEPGDSTMIPDNSGLISMNKAQAKDRSVRTATEYVHEQPKLDNAVAAHALSTQGQKVSEHVVKMAVSHGWIERGVLSGAAQRMAKAGVPLHPEVAQGLTAGIRAGLPATESAVSRVVKRMGGSAADVAREMRGGRRAMIGSSTVAFPKNMSASQAASVNQEGLKNLRALGGPSGLARHVETQAAKISSPIADAVEKVALSRDTMVRAGHKLGLIGGARAEKAFARSLLRDERQKARGTDLFKKGLVEYQTESPVWQRSVGETDFRNAIMTGERAARVGVKG